MLSSPTLGLTSTCPQSPRENTAWSTSRKPSSSCISFVEAQSSQAEESHPSQNVMKKHNALFFVSVCTSLADLPGYKRSHMDPFTACSSSCAQSTWSMSTIKAISTDVLAMMAEPLQPGSKEATHAARSRSWPCSRTPAEEALVPHPRLSPSTSKGPRLLPVL